MSNRGGRDQENIDFIHRYVRRYIGSLHVQAFIDDRVQQVTREQAIIREAKFILNKYRLLLCTAIV